jgi:Bacteriocin-protection, YdeI or OmpD-Associated/Domain of unknown function (DUF1905)
MKKFKATIDLIGINPFVFVPEPILLAIFERAGKDKGYIPVFGTINGDPYKQTLVKYNGHWRFYINTTMLRHSPKRIGEVVEITIDFDPADRTISSHPEWEQALRQNKAAKKVFDGLPPSRKKEITRYIAALKTEVSRTKNIQRAIGFLVGKNKFVGRNKP